MQTEYNLEALPYLKRERKVIQLKEDIFNNWGHQFNGIKVNSPTQILNQWTKLYRKIKAMI